MKRSTVRMIVGGVVILLAVGGLLIWNQLQQILAPPTLTVSYATVRSELPPNVSCAGGSTESGGIAKEILNLETDDIFVAGGSNPMSDEVWENYNFRLPILQNSTRNLMFQGSCFYRSPDVPSDCEGDACFSISEIADHTWLKLTTLVGVSCFPSEAGCSGETVEAGYVSINTIAKCHQITYEAGTIYELSDGTGNVYVMHATATGTPDLNAALPDGWTLNAREISEPLVLLPFGGGNDCYYNVLRDNLVQSYHQIAYAGERYPSSP